VLFKFKIGDIQVPIVFTDGSEGHIEVLMLPLGRSVQIDGIGGNLSR
jgi:hypothetical protein